MSTGEAFYLGILLGAIVGGFLADLHWRRQMRRYRFQVELSRRVFARRQAD